MAKLPQIPSVHSLPIDVRNVLIPIKEIIETREGKVGDIASRNVTYQDLIDLGLITKDDLPSS